MDRQTRERIEKLRMANAVEQMETLGRLLVDGGEMTIWEHDTARLPLSVRPWREKARRFAREHIRPLAGGADLDPSDFDTGPILQLAAKHGFQNLLLHPRASLLQSTIAEELATEDGGIALLILAHNLGVAPLVLAGHLPTWLRHLYPLYRSLSRGKPLTMAFAITEPEAGSDVEETEGGAVARLTTVARRVEGGYLLNGTKVFISDGAIADWVTVFARLEGEGLESWTCFLVKKGVPGFSVGRHERKMGQRAADASELVFENAFVPDDHVVGKPRSGWPLNRNVLNYSRPVVGAMALGHGRGAFERALDFCRRTTLGRKRLIEYQEFQIELADMMISLCAARAMIWHACAGIRAVQSLSAAAKVCGSDTAFKVCNQAMEIMGDEGYLHSNGVERAWRDSRLTQIYEGTNQINRLALVEHQWNAEFD
jgi:alkylation response protein AidB-like acyl-CoA dehydrogenase